MRIKAFENFSLGKLGNKNKPGSPEKKDAKAVKTADHEAKVSQKTKDLKKAAAKLDEIKDEDVIEIPTVDIPVRPHGPAAELTIDEEIGGSSGIKLDEEISDEPVILGGEIKVTPVTVQALGAIKTAPAPAPVSVTAPSTAAALAVEGKKEDKPAESDSLNNLFSQDEEEENPLDSLIKSLPDVTVRELMDDLSEIHRIIKEWSPNAK
jgi:hypothetical protein